MPMDMGSDHHRFSGNYMILRPEEVSLCDLLGILTNRDIAKKAFVEIPTGGEENLRYRWFMFMSLLGQKLLQCGSKRLSKVGSAFEKWLNILSSNGNLGLLLLHVLQGKELVVPEKTSDKFLSFVGHLDKRMELDENIKHGDSRYYAMLCAMASKLSYENEAVVKNTVENCWKMELLGYYDFWNDFQGKPTTQGFMFHDTTIGSDTIIIAFRGTEFFDANAWCTDLDISWYEFPGMGKIHGGFMKALGLVIGEGFPREHNYDKPLAYYTLRDQLRELLRQKSGRKFILTGHSLGGALAILFPIVLAMHEDIWLLQRLEGVHTFGQPRVGDVDFKKYMELLLQDYKIKYLRFVYCNDMIPRLPHDDSMFMFKHFGTCLYYDSCYNGKIVEEEPDKNYILLLGVIPRFLNGCWELLRCFILPYKEGPDFVETSLLKLVRFFGLLLPGLVAHNPQDYVNLTRLGSPRDIIAQACTKINGKVSSSFRKAHDQI